MRQALILGAITAALFCALSAVFIGVAASTHHPAKKAPPAPQIREVWV